jgi:VWFA-related protein
MPIPFFSCQRFISQSLIVAGIAALFAGSTLVAQGQATEPSEKNGDQRPSIKLRVAGNLVVVRVVVRDAHGAPVENLRNEDFRVYDNGKEQSIAQFEARAASKSDQLPLSPAQPSSTAEPSQSPVMPATFLALYFDDLSMADTDVVYARDAAERYLKMNLQPAERVAIFTASGEPQSDFTDNLKQLHDVLSNLRSSPRRNNLHGCPDLSDYEAQEIVDHPDPKSGSDAWRVALDEVYAHCPAGPEKLDPDHVPLDVLITVRERARSAAAQAELRARDSLGGLNTVVKALSHVSGQRSLIMISPGFMSSTLRAELDHTINRALRSEVVISAIDPKGMFMLSGQANAGRDTVPWGTAQRNRLSSDLQGEHTTSSVLAEVADGTGGEYFHDSNDLSAGFPSLTGFQVSYILAFVPTDLKLDGRFHHLKVTLAKKSKGIRLQARRGYFARPHDVKKSDITADIEPAPAH